MIMAPEGEQRAADADAPAAAAAPGRPLIITSL